MRMAQAARICRGAIGSDVRSTPESADRTFETRANFSKVTVSLFDLGACGAVRIVRIAVFRSEPPLS